MTKTATYGACPSSPSTLVIDDRESIIENVLLPPMVYLPQKRSFNEGSEGEWFFNLRFSMFDF